MYHVTDTSLSETFARRKFRGCQEPRNFFIFCEIKFRGWASFRRSWFHFNCHLSYRVSSCKVDSKI